AIGLPDLDQGVDDGGAIAVEDDAREPDGIVRRRRNELLHSFVRQADVEERPDRLRRGGQRHHCSIGVDSRPRSTMSNSYASAHSGTVRERSKPHIIRSRAFASCTELKIGSWKKSGSPGKYI